LSALSVALILHKKIRTTTAKAKEARMVVEKLITRAKRAVAKEGDAKMKDVHARREAFAFLRDRSAVSALFNEIATKVATRPGGYTRVVKLGQRQGDGAEVAILELVDYNTGQEKAAPKPKAKAGATRKRTPKPKAGTPKKAEEKKGGTEAAAAPATAEPAQPESKGPDSQ
jgi:large subunit ribosomal protein L17